MNNANDVKFLKQIAIFVVVGVLFVGGQLLRAEGDEVVVAGADKPADKPAVVDDKPVEVAVAPSTPPAAADAALNVIAEIAKADTLDDDDDDDDDDDKSVEERLKRLENRVKKMDMFHKRLSHMKFKGGKNVGKHIPKKPHGKKAAKKAAKGAKKRFKVAKKAGSKAAHNN